jgi:hypothetical protein
VNIAVPHDPLSTVSGTLREIRRLVGEDVYGWGQPGASPGRFDGRAIPRWDHAPGICLHDALVRSITGRRREALELLCSMIGVKNSIGLVAWNDARGRTERDVYQLLDLAIETAEAREQA